MEPFAVVDYNHTLEVHKNENILGTDFAFYTISLVVLLIYECLVKINWD